MKVYRSLKHAIQDLLAIPELSDVGRVALLIVLGLSARPAYRMFCTYRIERTLETAKAAARAGDWTAARDGANRVLQARPDDLDACRVWTRALAKLGGPLACTAASKLLSTPRASREDRLEALRLLVVEAPQAVTLDLYNNLPKELTAQASFRAAITPLLVKRGEIESAESQLREVMQASDGPDARLELLRLLCQRPSPQRLAEARRIFADLVAGNANEQALAALPLLGAVAGGLAPAPPLPDLQAWLKQQPQATASHHLLAINPDLEARPDAADQVYQSAVKRFLTSDPGPLGTWLLDHGQAAIAATVLEKPAKTRPDAYLLRLRALLLLGQQPALEAALRKPPTAAVDLVEIEILRAKYAMLRADPIGTDAAWDRALRNAVYYTTRNRFIDIARSAETCHATDAVEDAWLAAIRLGWGPLPLYRDLLPVFASMASHGRSEDLLAMFQELQRFEPANAALQNDVCYFSLIHGMRTPAQVAATMATLGGQQDRPAFQLTLMLAEILDGRCAEALARLPKLRGSEDVKPLLLTALEGSARVLAGETEAGTRLLKELDWNRFMPRERSVFRDLLINAKVPGLPVPDLEGPRVEANPDQTPAWRNAVHSLSKERATDSLPPMPPAQIR